MITKKIVAYCYAFNHSFAQNIFLKLTWLFLFKELSKIFKDFCGKFKDSSRISHNFSIFKDFSRPVRTMQKDLRHRALGACL